MIELTVECTAEMGPLDVSVFAPGDGEPIEFTLSSGSTSKTLPARTGRYTIVARRPNGSRLSRTAQVDGDGARVNLAASIPQTPNEFMERENIRGQIAVAIGEPALRPGSPLSGVFADILSNAMIAAVAPDRDGPQPGLPPRGLRTWSFDGSRWLDDPGVAASTAQSVEFQKVWISPPNTAHEGVPATTCVCISDETSFGPIVVVPPFADSIEITFVKRGLAVLATDRDAAPGQQRVPVALATPSMPAVADLLSALASPSVGSAEAIWSQVAPALGSAGVDRVEDVLGLLVDKFSRPAEAFVAAHYLLRFMPARLPLHWAENLSRVIPFACDGPVIAAWSWIYNRPSDATDADVNKAVVDYVTMALDRPVTLFARSRTLLLEARSLVPDGAASDPRWSRVQAFWRAGAGAGGLECFWGRDPENAGLENRPKLSP